MQVNLTRKISVGSRAAIKIHQGAIDFPVALRMVPQSLDQYICVFSPGIKFLFYQNE